ncbi:olfactory receptor 1G1 [Xenopus laevis]|uniref:Olfactory receptor n=1 Tax=Xenopus laevis TaxID=8355 RepID=A0A8J0UP69_XENLA|nr:olfactory receptor 1G1 [Xenopus laevis]
MTRAQMKGDEKSENWTVSSEFYILAFSTQPQSQVVLFIGILGIYLIAMIGNMIITMLILLVVQLHTPMYFFLCNLSLLDMTFVSVTLPKLLSITLKNIGTISFNACIAQMYFFISTANIESFLLTSMAYDRYVAICNPLRYPLILTKTSMLLLSTVSWFLGFSNSFVLTLLTSNLSFCRSHTIQNFFCDLKALLKLSCSDTTTIERIILVDNFLIGFIPYMLTMTSYVYIIATVLKIQSLQGKLKAFSNLSVSPYSFLIQELVVR